MAEFRKWVQFLISKTANLVQRRVTTQAVLHILGERVNEAGIDNCNPHDFRRSFISDLLDAGADIATVQKLAGQVNVTTTSRYNRRGEVAKQKAAGLLKVPYKIDLTKESSPN